MKFEYEDMYPTKAVRYAYACMGLAHPVRWAIVHLLKKKGGRLTVKELLDLLQREYGYKQNRAPLDHHLGKMEKGGIIRVLRPNTRKN